MGDLIKIAAPVASIFNPAIGAGLGAVGSVIEGGKARKQSKRYASQQEQILADQQRWINEVYLPAVRSFMAEQGFNAQTGQWDASAREPYANVQNPFAVNRPAEIARFTEDTDMAADQAMEQFLVNSARSGMFGSSDLASQIAGISRGVAQDLAGFRRDTAIQANEWESNRQLMNIDESTRRMMATLGLAGGAAGAMGAPLGGIGGLQTMASEEARANDSNMANLMAAVVMAGRDKTNKRGDNTLGTNQRPTPIGGPTTSPGFRPLPEDNAAVGGLAGVINSAAGAPSRAYAPPRRKRGVVR